MDLFGAIEPGQGVLIRESGDGNGHDHQSAIPYRQRRRRRALRRLARGGADTGNS